MYEALKHGRLTNVKIRETIAAGLAPPFAGELFSLYTVKA